MTINRKLRNLKKFRNAFKKFGKEQKTRDKINLIVFLGYLKFMKEWSSRSRLLAHEERSKSISDRHVRKSAKVILDRAVQRASPRSRGKNRGPKPVRAPDESETDVDSS